MKNQALESLTPREREILVHIGEGKSLPEIAHSLHRSLKTIESHRLSLGRKLNASNRVELAHIAIATGLVAVGSGEFSADIDESKLDAQELQWLRQINDAVEHTSGIELITKFCEAASMLPKIEVAALCTPDPLRPLDSGPYHRYVIATAQRGEPLPSTRYHAINTPCQAIIEDGVFCAAEGVSEAYPEDSWLAQLKAESYVGSQLCGDKGQAVGGVALISKKVINNMEPYQRIIDFFAPHLARALEVRAKLESLKAQNEQLETQLLERRLIAEQPKEENASTSGNTHLARIASRVHALAGVTFLRHLLDNICETFDVVQAGIFYLDPDSEEPMLNSIVFRDTGVLADMVCYAVEGTPCQVALEQGEFCLDRDAQKVFPNDEFLSENGSEGYVGVRLSTHKGEVIGILWVLDNKQLEQPQALERVLQFYAPRVSSELVNFLHLEQLLQDKERLEKQMESRQA